MCSFCNAGVFDIYGDHAIACHGRGDAIARHDRIRDKIVSACSFANLSPVLEKKNLIPESQSHAGDIFVPTCKAGKAAPFDVNVTSSLQSNSLTKAATEAKYALDAADEKKIMPPRRKLHKKWETYLSPFQLKSLAEYRQS